MKKGIAKADLPTAKVEGGGLKHSMAPKEEVPEEWEVKSAVEALERAHEIRQDKRLMPHVHKHMGKKIKSLKDLRNLANQATHDPEEQGQESLEKKELAGDVDANED